MSAKHYVVTLTATERAQLERAARSNKRSRRERVRARVLLGVDTAGSQGGWTDTQASCHTGASLNTVARVRQRFALQGYTAALHHAEQPRRKARRLEGAGRSAFGRAGVQRACRRA
jgi:hypothetical protein